MKTKNKHLNSPLINRKHNYVYQLENTINGMIYIGVHRTDDTNDGYMGSGKILKRSQEKYGLDVFKKTILFNYKTYQEALDKERELVNSEFINLNTNYNIREGGYGNCEFSKDALVEFSKIAKNRWKDEQYRERMKIALATPERSEKIGKKVRKWIADHPEEHAIRMDKINKNPNKIKKTADKHRGMKRSKEACENVSSGLKKFQKNNPKRALEVSGKGLKYIHNITTKEIRRLTPNEDVPEGWKLGTGLTRNYAGMNKDTIFIVNNITGKRKRIKKDDIVPDGWHLLRKI